MKDIKDHMSYLNGGLHDKLQDIGDDVHKIRDELTISVDKLSRSIDNLTSRLDNFIIVAQNSIPIKAVFWLLAIMVMGLVGVEGIKEMPELFKHMWP